MNKAKVKKIYLSDKIYIKREIVAVPENELNKAEAPSKLKRRSPFCWIFKGLKFAQDRESPFN